MLISIDKTCKNITLAFIRSRYVHCISEGHSLRFLLELYYDLTKVIDLDETNIRAFLSRALVHRVPKSYKDASSSART
jgi:hypothetical protein